MSLRIDELPQFFKRLIDGSEDAINESLSKVVELITEDMREPGSPVTYPIQWDSEKQRRFVMAKLKKDNDLPYTRKGDYVQGWTKTPISNGWEISNKHPAGAIGGTLKGTPSLIAQGGIAMTTWQSKIHRSRWKVFSTTAAQRLSELPKKIIKAIKLMAGNLD